MLIDARTLPDKTTLDADLAVIGGGAAGITLARALAGTGIDVCVLEAGGLKYDPEVQALYEGESVGIDYRTDLTRQRFLGGSSNHWGGYCRPLDAIDFERRDWLPYSGWPFGIGELTSYYEKAADIVQVTPGHFDDIAYWEKATGVPIPPPVTGRIWYQFVHFSPPTHFGERYREDLEKGDGVRVLYNANVTSIRADENAAAVRGLAVRTLDGLSHEVRARCYVLATGGLENPRVLLYSNDVVKAGLGNQNDLVGRFFMEHVHPRGFGETVVGELRRMPELFYQRVWDGKRSAQIAFNPTESLLRRERLLNASFMVGLAGRYPAGKEPDAGDDRSRDHLDMLKAAQGFLKTGTDRDGQQNGDELGVWLGMGGTCEQEPNPDSRVSLSTERDRLGLPKIKLDWRLTDRDRESFYTHLRYLALEFGAMGTGRMRRIVPEDDWTRPIEGGSHHMGTTRMSDDPKTGVVDRHCRVHGLANLYIAGSSVFPTGGVSNPTLTLIALALRLADRLKEVLK